MAEGSPPPHARRRSLPVIAVPACTDCGTCCLNEHPRYIRVFAVDLERMSEAAFAHTTLVDGERYLRFEGGRCSALALHPATGRVGCTIYEERPDACRWLERGSGECRSQLAAKWDKRETLMASLGT